MKIMSRFLLACSNKRWKILHGSPEESSSCKKWICICEWCSLGMSSERTKFLTSPQTHSERPGRIPLNSPCRYVGSGSFSTCQRGVMSGRKMYHAMDLVTNDTNLLGVTGKSYWLTPAILPLERATMDYQPMSMSFFRKRENLIPLRRFVNRSPIVCLY